MKIKIVLFAAIIALASCSRSKIKEEPVKQSSSRMNAVFSASDVGSRIRAYNLLTPSERVQLWQTHLKKAKDQFTAEHRPDKVILIDELMNKLTVVLFSDSTSSQEAFQNDIMPEWLKKARKIFNEFELYDLAADPTADPIGNITSPGLADTSIK